jgi:hypothetical protein
VRRVLICCLLATACSGGSPAPAKPLADITTLETKAQLTGCRASGQPLTAASALCNLGESQVTLATFVSIGQRDLWVRAQRGVAAGYVATGSGWAATALESDAATAVATALGGTVQR